MLEIKGINFSVEIEKKKIKNIYLRVKGNVVYATCPMLMPEYKVYQFIESKRDWIYKVYQYTLIKNEYSLLYRGGNTFFVFNEPYKLIKNEGRKNITILGNHIYFTYKDDSEESIKALYKYMDKYLLEKAQIYYEKYKPMLLDYGYTLDPEIHARCMTSKWGCCFTRNNKINISSYLIHYPIECLEYIMIHEMTHFIVPNHSKRFYEIIQSRMPNYKQAEKKLK